MKRLFLSLAVCACMGLGAYEKPILEGYWESWNYRDSIETIASMPSDVIAISFGTFQPMGEHTFVVVGVEATKERIEEMVELAQARGKKVKLSIGGANYGQSGLLFTREDAVGMADALARYVVEFGLDGVDLDIEDYPAVDLQVELIKRTREALGPDALLTYTPKAPAATTLPYCEVIAKSHEYLDGVHIMAYDAWEGYSYQEDSESLSLLGVPREKIVIGLMPGMDDIGGYTSLEDIQDAVNWVKARGLGGIMLWDLNRDHANLTGLGEGAASTVAWEGLQSARTPRS
ncbi:MAG: Chitinase D [Chlamydiae bacterium]|nr:Chitinase D [Chlamydiota bacterium]